jgi:hypothetical protein
MKKLLAGALIAGSFFRSKQEPRNVPETPRWVPYQERWCWDLWARSPVR